MSTPKTEIKGKSVLGHLNYIAQFISQMTTTYELIIWFLWKKNPKVRNKECQETFDKIK